MITPEEPAAAPPQPKLISATHRFRFGSLALITALLAIVLVTGNYLSRKDSLTTIGSKADAGAIDLEIIPNTLSLPPDGIVDIALNADTHVIGHAIVKLTFDKTKINLSDDIITNNVFQTVNSVSSLTDANGSGAITIDLSYDPNATGQTSTPSGIVAIAELKFKSVTDAPDQTAELAFGTGTVLTDLANPDTALALSPVNCEMTLNSGQPSPTPSPTLAPGQTPTPTILPTVTPTSAPGPTATPIPQFNQADANQDGKVDTADFLVWQKWFGYSAWGPQYGDFNKDALVNGLDYAIWLKNRTK
jgi:hypothetical protein